MSERYLAGNAVLMTPEEAKPPLKTKILTLSKYGIIGIGHYEHDFHVAWAPLPKIPAHIKESMKLKPKPKPDAT